MIENFVLTVLASAAVSSALAILLLWLTKTWINERLKNAIQAEYSFKLESYKAQLKAEYDKQIETHKVQLKSQSDTELEKLRASLSIVSAQQNLIFTRLHERRVEVLANTYSHISKLRDCVESLSDKLFLSANQSENPTEQSIVSAFSEFKPYFSQNQVFIPKEIVSVIRESITEVGRINYDISTKRNLEIDLGVEEWLHIKAKLDSILNTLEVEVRKAIGDRDP